MRIEILSELSVREVIYRIRELSRHLGEGKILVGVPQILPPLDADRVRCKREGHLNELRFICNGGSNVCLKEAKQTN